MDDIAKSLISREANVCAVDERGKTALMYAHQKKMNNIKELLLDAGAPM
jgi:ankyrin repeat protein